MEQKKLVDLVLDELMSTRQLSISIRRTLRKKGVDYSDEVVSSIERILQSKSLVDVVGTDSRGYSTISLTVTGQDFIKTYGSYSKFIRGVESENKKVIRAKKKKPYQTHTGINGKPPLPFIPKEDSFFQKNRASLFVLFVVLVLFYIVSKITENVV